MSPLGVVKYLDVIEHIASRLIPIAIDPALDPLTLEQLEEAFGDRIVMTVAAATHAANKIVGSEKTLPIRSLSASAAPPYASAWSHDVAHSIPLARADLHGSFDSHRPTALQPGMLDQTHQAVIILGSGRPGLSAPSVIATGGAPSEPGRDVESSSSPPADGSRCISAGLPGKVHGGLF